MFTCSIHANNNSVQSNFIPKPHVKTTKRVMCLKQQAQIQHSEDSDFFCVKSIKVNWQNDDQKSLQAIQMYQWPMSFSTYRAAVHYLPCIKLKWYYITVLLMIQQTKQPFELLRWPGSKSTINVTEHTKRECEVALCLSTLFPHSSMTTSKPMGFFWFIWIHLGNTCQTFMFNTWLCVCVSVYAA